MDTEVLRKRRLTQATQFPHVIPISASEMPEAFKAWSFAFLLERFPSLLMLTC